MTQTAIDFSDECDALYELLQPLAEADFDRKTLFKDWTINDVLAHLHFFNYAADLTLKDGDAFMVLLGSLRSAREGGESLVAATDRMLDGAKGRALLTLWHDYYLKMADNYAAADPKQRIKWAGPDMSVRSSVTARLMETWAHGQEIYDLLGVERRDGDRIKNIVVLGVNTFGWTFSNRGEDLPADKPYLRLTAPSGDVWEWHEPSDRNLIEGSATDFCQVVTQTRNIADTGLRVVGDTATRWMSMAQCFAGEPQNPPPPGTRHA
jgi:uncharacterized protein (TIGR03084 family)